MENELSEKRASNHLALSVDLTQTIGTVLNKQHNDSAADENQVYL